MTLTAVRREKPLPEQSAGTGAAGGLGKSGRSSPNTRGDSPSQRASLVATGPVRTRGGVAVREIVSVSPFGDEDSLPNPIRRPLPDSGLHGASPSSNGGAGGPLLETEPLALRQLVAFSDEPAVNLQVQQHGSSDNPSLHLQLDAAKPSSTDAQHVDRSSSSASSTKFDHDAWSSVPLVLEVSRVTAAGVEVAPVVRDLGKIRKLFATKTGGALVVHCYTARRVHLVEERRLPALGGAGGGGLAGGGGTLGGEQGGSGSEGGLMTPTGRRGNFNTRG